MKQDNLKGRGARIQPKNVFSKTEEVQEHLEGLDRPKWTDKPHTKFIHTATKNALSKNDSPDLPLNYSVNPYQGCEHGCVYCYARNSHQYWGYDAGLGFETNILVKHDIVSQLRKTFDRPGYQARPLMLSGNTDCYQPAEKKYQLTRKILSLCLEYGHPVSVITKNTLIERDLDLLKALAERNIVHVYFSINHLDPKLKAILEPRTATAQKKLGLIEKFDTAGVPCGIMVAPIIPTINSEDITAIIRDAAAAGARKAGYTVIRLNGQVRQIFQNWLQTHFPERAEKVMHQIESLHGGKANDSEWGRRIKGEGELASLIQHVFRQAVKKYLLDRKMPIQDLSQFIAGKQTRLFK
ncbi:PA0069 family radical SAM protein [Pleomorphovibrio marinus]|uniref:PA0069 family radical SAM protein n=1 Tax=Pleomorphovibrio marinus TaxID=2164132 RepID=UPI000E0C0190|nr:PA0069 family radical SAM protein [Pleomorphovibrio marinus]